MERLKFLAVATVAMTAVCFTSCLKGNANESSGMAFGVANSGTYGETTINAVDPNKGYLGALYAPSIQSEMPYTGDCSVFTYQINYDDQAAAAGKKYTLAAISDYTKIEQTRLFETTLHDSIIPEPKEDQIPINMVQVGAYLDYNLFFVPQLNLEDKQTVRYEFYYNKDSVETKDNNNLYSLFVVAKGTPSTGTTKLSGSYEASNIRRFYEMAASAAKDANKKEFYFKVKYVTSAKDGNNTTYKMAETETFTLPLITESEE